MKRRYLIVGLILTSLLMWACEGDTTAPDRDAPEAPTGLAFDPNYSDGEIKIDWTASVSSDVQMYYVYRSDGGGEFEQVAMTENLTHMDTGLEYDVEYSYKISATDGENESEFSNTVSVTPINLRDPATPDGTAIAAHHLIENFPDVELTWLANQETDFLQYKIYRAENPLFLLDENSFLDSTSDVFYFDNNVSAGTTYYYKLIAIDKGGLESDPTTVLSDTPLQIPELVSPINQTQIASQVPTFQWRDVNGSHHFKILLKTAPQSDSFWSDTLHSSGTDGGSLSYEYNGSVLSANTQYYWLLEGYSQDSEETNVYSATQFFRTAP